MAVLTLMWRLLDESASHCLLLWLNERTKLMNKGSPIAKLSPPLPRYGERFISTRTSPKKSSHDFSSVIEIFC